MTENEKMISGMIDRILVKSKESISDLYTSTHAVLLDGEHHLVFRSSYDRAEKSLKNISENNMIGLERLTIKTL